MVETPVDGHDVLVEGRVEGIDLDRLLAERGRPGLPVASVLEWITQSAAALTGLHQNGEVHGDVRPANLVVEPSGSIKLIPPGSSKLPHGNGRSADTAGFRAPEVSAGATPDHRTDVYGLAATTFALLTGATPSTGSANGAAQQVGLLDSALQAGLAADPERRPATPGELAERLRAAWDADTPTGPRTILVSDAIDDASGTNRHPGMQLAVDRAVEDHGGRRIGLMVGGSAAVSVFADAVSAVRAAIALQRGLGQSLESVPVQVGLASCDVADASALDALATQAGRVKDLAGPGEILLSASTAELVRERLRNEMRLVALGPNSVDDADGALAVATVGINAPPDSSRNPYPGLAAFGGSDSDLFFGREQIIEQCLDLLGSERFVAVVGVPGSGKSSLLHAGLVPRLPDAVLLRPGEHPQQSLVDAGAAARPDAVLVVDQLEDIVTRCQAPEERAAFVEAIVDHPGGLAVALRADRYGEFAQFAEFSQLLSSCHVLLGPLVADEVARAVTEPARRCAVDLEDGLTELIAAERPGEPGDLPQLGHALRETWLRREGSTMTLAGYRATGGVQSAVAETAERTYTALDEPDRLVARKLLLRMADLRADGLIPRPVSADEVADVDHARAPAVLSAFASAGLVVVDGDGAVEAPEALSRAWPRLAEWIAKQRATYVVQPKPPRVRSRATQLAVIAVSTSLIAVTAIAMGVVAVTERDAANEQRDVAQSRSLVADARAAATDQPDAAMLLAVEAHADAPS
ncbi:MAG TPA: protein kinase, partial [Jiangellaceae bacterium]